MYQEIDVEQRASVCWIYLSRANKMNALTSQMVTELVAAVKVAAHDPSIRSLVISGRGKAFCAGADLVDVPPATALSQPEKNFFDLSDDLADALHRFKKPIVVAVNGVACAGGLELLLFADVVIASENTKIGDVHSNFGFIPGLGGSARLTRAVGAQRARYLLFSGAMITAEEAQHWGLVAHVVPREQLERYVQEFCDSLSSKSQRGLVNMRKLVNSAIDLSLEDAIQYERTLFREYYHTAEVQEGQAAFREKREPNFSRFNRC